MQPHPSIPSPEPEIAVAACTCTIAARCYSQSRGVVSMHRKLAALTGKSETELNWIFTRCKNPETLTCTQDILNIALFHLECIENKDFRRFPTKGQPLNKGQRACSQSVLYSGAPL